MPARMSVRFVITGAVLLSASLAGCGYYEGGNMRSLDRHVYVSTTWQPKTVNLVDTRTGETVWSMDVPVGQKLAMEFVDNERVIDSRPHDAWLPDTMRWGLGDSKNTSMSLANEISVPPASIRRIEWTLRPVPEMPPSNGPNGTDEDVYVLPDDALPEATPEDETPEAQSPAEMEVLEDMEGDQDGDGG